MIEPALRLPLAFTLLHRVVPDEIDEYAHVNNAVYLQWLDRIAWTHSAKLGMTLADCLALRRGMAVRHTRIDYLALYPSRVVSQNSDGTLELQPDSPLFASISGVTEARWRRSAARLESTRAGEGSGPAFPSV